MTAVLVLRPEFTDTFARALARIAGTILGAGAATRDRARSSSPDRRP